MSPELVFFSQRLKQLWDKPTWRKRLLAIVLDEAHCINQWGNDFRPAYARVGELRCWVPPKTAFIALSATLPEPALKTLKTLLLYGPDVTVINEGNDRSNVKYKVSGLQHAASTYQDLAFVLDFQKTIVYFQSREESEAAGKYLRTLVPLHMRDKIAAYHSIKSEGRKAFVMDSFRSNRILILLSTEAAGMGCDISDVLRVVQYKCPSSLSTLIQRIGRAARDIHLRGIGLLLTQSLKSPAVMNADDRDLRRYITTEGCRRAIMNEVFNNKPRHVDDCCDNCAPDPPASVVIESEDRIRSMVRNRDAVYTKEDKERVENAIKQWRLTTFDCDYRPRSTMFTLQCVMPDFTIRKIVSKLAKISSP
ncbi:ATP-dependent DNA helicase sgs1, partial [Podila clonocystis]